MLEKVYFYTEDQIELIGLLETPSKPTKKVVISIHGMQSNCLKQRETILSQNITNAGIAYFTFNNRGAEVMTYTKKVTGEKILNGEIKTNGYHDINKMFEDILNED